MNIVSGRRRIMTYTAPIPKRQESQAEGDAKDISTVCISFKKHSLQVETIVGIE